MFRQLRKEKIVAIEEAKVTTKIEEHTFEDFVGLGMNLREKADNLSWALGDLAIDVTTKFGREGFNAFAKEIGVKVNTLRRYRDVARAYPKKKIRKELMILSWSHFRQVAAKEDRILLLTRACDESWSCEKLIEMTKDNKDDIIDDGKPVPPKPEMILCLKCRKWKILNKSEICKNDNKCLDIKVEIK